MVEVHSVVSPSDEAELLRFFLEAVVALEGLLAPAEESSKPRRIIKRDLRPDKPVLLPRLDGAGGAPCDPRLRGE